MTPTQGLNPYLLGLLRWQVGSLPLSHLGSPTDTIWFHLCLWNLKYDMNVSMKQTPDSQTQRTDLWLLGGQGRRGTEWECRICRCKLLNIGWLNNKVLLCSTGTCIQYPVVQSLSRVRPFAAPWTAAPRLLCPPLSPRVCSNSCPLSRWCHPTISSSVTHFSSSCPQSFPASGSFPKSQLFTSGDRSTGASASASDLPMNIQGWYHYPMINYIGKEYIYIYIYIYIWMNHSWN